MEARRVMKKAGAILMAAGLSIGMCCPSVSAATQLNKTQLTKAAKSVTPEEWNQEEIKVYQFDSDEEYENYMLTGGTHLYTNKYSTKDHWVKIKVVDSGIMNIEVESEKEDKIPLYDATKKKVLKKDLNGLYDDYMVSVKAGDEFYIKLPTKITGKITIAAGAYKSGFTSMTKNGKTYYEVGQGTTTIHPFSLTTRSEVYLDVTAEGKVVGNITATIERYTKGKWVKVGYSTTFKPTSDGDDLMYGLQSGNYRLKLKNPKDQVLGVEYNKESMSKKAVYKKSKAIKVNEDAENIYTEGEQAARWYKVVVKSTKHRRILELDNNCIGGGFKFVVYKNGQKKAIKTAKIKSDGRGVEMTLPKQKATYYIQVSKLTKKTNGAYFIEHYEE